MPDCGSFMANMGLDFESPKKDDVKKWEHLKSLYSVGITFHSCGCSGPGYIPNSKEKLVEYFENLKSTYLKNIDFWRTRVEPVTKLERDKDNQQNGGKLNAISSNFKKEIVKNQDGIDFWLTKVREIESRISVIK